MDAQTEEKPKKKITRKALMWICAGLGIFLIVYSLVRQLVLPKFLPDLNRRLFPDPSKPPAFEKWLFDGIVFGALAIFMYNRKLAKDERAAAEAAEQARIAAEEAAANPEPEEDVDDEDLPHWERKNSGDE
jgi:hypothetical protein